MVVPTSSLGTSPFTLSTSGVAGVIGGDEAVSAIASVHVYENRRWFGWYNSPGSYQISKRLGLLAKSRIPDSFSPRIHTDPAKMMKLDIIKCPKFRAAHSGTVIEDAGNVASLVMKECATREGIAIGEGRKTGDFGVTVIKLDHEPLARMYPKRANPYTPMFASIPISISLASCVACGTFGDLYAFSLILLGMLANGITSLVIGSGQLQFTHPLAANASPPGDGILISSSGKEIVLLMGAEGAVNSITRGSFSLSFHSEIEFERIRWCSVLFTIQFIAQLLLIPQASLSGQILFVISLGVSWLYNSCLTSLHKDKLQRDILFDKVLEKLVLTKYTLGTFTSAVFFSLLILRPNEPIKFLDEFLPDTNVWREWKRKIVQQLDKEEPQFAVTDGRADRFTGDDSRLFEKLCSDAQAVYSSYTNYFRSS